MAEGDGVQQGTPRARFTFFNTVHDWFRRHDTRALASQAVLLGSCLMSFLCFMPSFAPFTPATNAAETSGTDDDYSYLVNYQSVSGYCLSSMFPLALVLLPAADLLLDRMPDYIVKAFYDSRMLEMRRRDDGMKGLSEIESALFMAGLAFTSLVVYSTATMGISAADMDRVALLFQSFSNVSTILTTAPVISFLIRRLTSANPVFIATISLLVDVGSFLNAVSYCFDPAWRLTANLLKAAAGCVLGSGALYALLCVWCFIGNARWEMAVRAGRPLSAEAASDTLHGTTTATRDARFDHAVLGAHMASILVQFVVQCIWYTAQPVTSADMATFVYTTSCAGALVLLMELRVRKFDLLQKSLALLDTKRAYVRYISHELRTPLNAASLGLNLVVDELARRADPRDDDLRDIVADVKSACAASVDILNDLLTFEKLESGILDLHKENVPALRFLAETVNIFSAQAKQYDVAVELVLEPEQAPRGRGAGALPLLLSDDFACDRFKLEQVLRNLVSNALKFSPRKGSIVIAAYFRPDVAAPAPTAATGTDEKKGDDVEACGGSGRGPSAASLGPLAIDGSLVIEVIDHGPGISATNQAKLFKNVVQFNPEKLQAGGGSGFGLFLSKGIMDLHGGTMAVHSDGEGLGCAFTMALPMTRRPHPTADLAPAHAAASRANSSQSLTSDADATTPRHGISVKELLRLSSGSSGSSGSGGDIVGGGASRLPPIIRAPSASSRVYVDDDPQPPAGSHAAPPNVRPVVATAATAAAATAAAPQLPPIYRLLVVDDSGPARKMLVRALRAHGHACEEAEDGQQAVDLVRVRLALLAGAMEGEGRVPFFDAILMDSVMPRMDGPTATKTIRAMGPAALRVPIVGVTGNAMPQDVQYFESMGASVVLAKPMSVEAFERFMKARREAAEPV